MATGVRRPAAGLRRYRTEVRHESRVAFAAYLQAVAEELRLPVSCDARTVARLEDGDVRWPHEPYRRLLEVATGWELADLGFLPREADRHRDTTETAAAATASAPVVPAPDWLEVHRRTLLLGATAGLAALARWKPPDGRREASPLGIENSPDALDPEAAEDMREIALHYRRAYRSLSPSRLMPHAFGHLQLAMSLRPGEQPSPVRRQLVATIAEMAALIGTMWSLDRREYTTGEQYLRLAARAAREVDDPDLEAFVLGGKAFHTAYSGDLRSGLHYVEGGRRVAERGNSGTNRGWLAAVSSELLASAGMERECQQLLEQAEGHLATPDEHPWVGVGAFNHAKLRAYHGGAMRRLGRYKRAEHELTKALEELPASMVKHRCTALVDLAETYALARDADRAAGRALEALGLAERTGHKDSVRRIRNIHRRLHYASDASAVQELHGRLQPS